MDDEQYENTIWFQCKLCYILLPQKYLIKNHLAETHSSELIQSPRHLHQLLQDNPNSSCSTSSSSPLQRLSSRDLQTEVCPTAYETRDMMDYVKVEHSYSCSDFSYPEVEVLLGLEKIKTESDDDDIKSASNISKPDLEDDTDFSKKSDSLSSFWREVEFPDAIVRLQDLTMPLPIGKKEGDTDEKCVCLICYKVFSSKQSLKSHRKTHKGEKRFICKTCGKSFTVEVNLQMHELEHSDDWPNLQANPELLAKERRRLLHRKHNDSLYVFPTKLQYPYCPKTFPYERHLKMHIQTHTKEKPCKSLECVDKAQKVFQNVIEANLFEFICLFCGYKAGNSYQLNLHNRSHTGEKPFKCLHCSKAFSNKRNMDRHMYQGCSVAKQKNLTVLPATNNKRKWRKLWQLDPEKKTKKCQYCDERFKSNYALKYHERAHGDKYPCAFCPTTAFALPKGLSMHIRRHHAWCFDGLVCAICNNRLASNSGLSLHYLFVHDTKLPTGRSTKTATETNSSTFCTSKLSKTNSNLQITEDPLAIGSKYSSDTTTNFLSSTDIKIKTTEIFLNSASPTQFLQE